MGGLWPDGCSDFKAYGFLVLFVQISGVGGRVSRNPNIVRVLGTLPKYKTFGENCYYIVPYSSLLRYLSTGMLVH